MEDYIKLFPIVSEFLSVLFCSHFHILSNPEHTDIHTYSYLFGQVLCRINGQILGYKIPLKLWSRKTEHNRQMLWELTLPLQVVQISCQGDKQHFLRRLRTYTSRQLWAVQILALKVPNPRKHLISGQTKTTGPPLYKVLLFS